MTMIEWIKEACKDTNQCDVYFKSVADDNNPGNDRSIVIEIDGRMFGSESDAIVWRKREDAVLYFFNQTKDEIFHSGCETDPLDMSTILRMSVRMTLAH